MIYILITLQILDLLTTIIALRNPKLTESNSFLKPIMDKLGVIPTLILIKGIFIGLLVFVYPMILPVVMYLLVGGYCWVVWNNIKLIRNN